VEVSLRIRSSSGRSIYFIAREAGNQGERRRRAAALQAAVGTAAVTASGELRARFIIRAVGMDRGGGVTPGACGTATPSAFQTGMYQTAIGAHHHRSHRDDNYRLPDGARVTSQ
jgi:hypothetical protein